MIFSFGTSTIIQPSFLFKMSEQVKPQVDLGATYITTRIFGPDWHIGPAAL